MAWNERQIRSRLNIYFFINSLFICIRIVGLIKLRKFYYRFYCEVNAENQANQC